MKYFINYKDEFSTRILLALVIFLVICTKTLSSADYVSVGSSQYPHVAPSPSVISHGRSGGVVQEKECCVARLCEYKILENFSCKVSEYVISNGLERSLPKWLWFDEGNQTLKGIPSPADEGLNELLIIGLRRHQNNPVGYICGLLTVKIVVWSLKDFPLSAQNVPTSPVINNRFSKPSTWQGFTCQFNEPIVLASLVLAGNFHEMDGKQKINVLDWLLQSYHISIYDVFVLSSSEDSLKGLLQSSHVLASGPGANRSASGLSTTITWHVRCGVMHLDDSLFQVMEKLSKQLTFINNVSYAPIGWHVVTGFQKHRIRRRRNVVGTTTPAYSTIPISRATVITTKIKVTRTTYVSQTKTFTWSRPLPTFSSPYTVNKTSLYNQSSAVSSRFNNTVIPSQYNSVSSTSPVMSLSSTMSPPSHIISPSKQETPDISQYKSVSPTLPVILSPGTMSSLSHVSSPRQTSEISQYERVSSTFPVTSSSGNKSAVFQISSSKQQTSSNSIKTFSQIHPTPTVTRLDSVSSTTSQLPSTKLRTFVQSSLTTSEKQRPTNVIVPSSRNITSPTVQTVINNASLSSTVFHSLSDISSLVISSLLTTEHYLTSSSKVSNVWSATAMTTATQPNNSTTSLLQSSYSNFIDTLSLSSSRTYSPVLHVTTSGIINETKSAKVNQTFESSTSHTRSILSTITFATNIAVTTQISYTIDPSYTPFISSESSVPTPSSFLPCTNSCSVSTFNNLNFTPTSREQQHTTTLYQASISTSESILSSSRITGTLVLNTRSVTPQTSDVDKTSESTSPMLISGIISKSLQSSDYVNSKTTKTLTTNSTIYSSRLGSKETLVSSNSAMSSQLTTGSAIQSTFTPISVMKPSSTGRAFHTMTSQSSSEYKSSLSLVSPTAHFSTAMVYTPTEQLRSTYSSLIETTPASTYTLSNQTKTIRSGSLITNIVPNPTVSSLFTSHISGAVSSYITRSNVGHSSMLSRSTLTGTIDQTAFKTQTSLSFSSLRSSPYKSSSSNKIFEKSTLTVHTTTPSPVFLSSYQTPTASSFATTTPSSYFLSSYTTATLTSIIHTFASSYKRTSPSSAFTTTPSLQSPSYKTGTLSSSVVTTTPFLHSLSYETSTSPYSLSSYKTGTSLSSVVTNTPSLHSLSSYKTGTSLSSVVTNTLSLYSLSSYKRGTSLSSVLTNTLSLHSLSSYETSTSLSSVLTTTLSLYSLSSYETSTSLSSVLTNTLSLYSLSSHKTGTSLSSVVTTTLSLYSLSSYKTGTSLSSVVTNTPSLHSLSSYETSTSLSSVLTNTPSLHSLSSHKTGTSLSSVVTTTLSLYSLSSYKTGTSLSSVVTNTPSLHSLSSYKTGTSLSSVVTNTLSLYSLSSHKTGTSLSSVVTNTPSLYSLSSHKTGTSLSSVVTNTLSLYSLSSYKTGTSLSSVFTTIPSSSYLALTSPLSFPTVSLSSDFLSSYHSSISSSSVVTTTALSDVLSSHTIATSQSSVITTILSSDQLPSSHTTSSLSTVATIIPSSYLLSSYQTDKSTSTVVTIASSSLYVSYRTRKSPSSAVTTTPYSLSSFKTGTSPSSIVTKTPSSNILSFYHNSTSPPSILTTPSLLTYVTTTSSSYHTLLSPSPPATITSSSVFPSFYHTPPTSPSSVDTVTPLSEFKSSYHTSTITHSLHSLTAHTTATLPTSVLTIISSPDYLSSYHTSTSPSSATITFSSYLFSYHTLASSFVATITSSFFLSSYHTFTSPLSPVTVASSVFLSSYRTPTSLSNVATITPSVYLSSSYNAILSPFSPSTESLRTSLSNLPSSITTLSSASYKTVSLSFLSSSIVSSQPSISFDLSTGSSMSYTSTKLSSQTSWLVRPSYTSRQSPQTTTVLTLTSIKMPVTTSSSGPSPSSTSSQSSSAVPTTPSKGSPKIYNDFNLLHVTVGKVFRVQIPVDTFHDREDGNTRNLRLECLTVAHASLSRNSWLQFNATTQTLYGLVLKSQVGKISSEYLLTASDRDGNTVFDAFTVIIDESSKLLAAMFSVKLTGISLEMFNRDIENILSIVQAIAGYYGDKDESMIQVLSLTEGSVIFTWSNTSLQTCDEDLINDIASKLITRQGNTQPDFRNALSPFIAGNTFVNYTGPCVVPSTENHSVSELSSHKTSPWLKYVLPALVVAVVIVVIAVAFLLVRRHSGVKLLKEDKQIFKRRKPIILDGEQEMSTLSGKPIEIPEDSLTPIRFPRESSFGTPEYDDDIPELPSPIMSAPVYQRLPPRYSDGGSNRYNTPPPPYKLPPSY